LKVAVKKIGRETDEQVVVHCHEVSEEVKSIVRFVKSTGATLVGYIEERASQIALQDILYVEAVDDRVFACTAKKTYELKCKLYEFEAAHEGGTFFRCSKSFIINLMKVDHVRPILNGRFSATMFGGEEVVISRQYVPELKKRLLGEKA
jgi:DNA-binding LytR/AlgR family response regulator